MKKVASLMVTAAMMVAMTGVAFATPPKPLVMPSNDVKVSNFGHADQLTVSGSLSNTGLNSFHMAGLSTSNTGAAVTQSTAQTQANLYETNVWGCSLCNKTNGDVKVSNVGMAEQLTVGVSVSNTGLNSFGGGMFTTNNTGAATAVTQSQTFGNTFTTNIVR